MEKKCGTTTTDVKIYENDSFSVRIAPITSSSSTHPCHLYGDDTLYVFELSRHCCCIYLSNSFEKPILIIRNGHITLRLM